MGALGVLVAQLPQAADRVEAGHRAVVRAAVFDVPVASFLVWEPGGDDVVVTLAVTAELSDPAWMPDSTQADGLYAFIESHHDELVAAGTADGVEPVTISRSMVGAALRREHRLGTEVISLLGEGSC